MKQKKQKPVKGGSTSARVIFRRTMLLLVIFGIGIFVPLGFRLYKLQITQHDELQASATRQQTSDVTLTATRGSIYDRNGKTLAVSTTVYNIILSPKDINTVSDKDLKAAVGDNYKSFMTDAQIEEAEANIVKERVELIASTLAPLLNVSESDIEERCQNTTSMYSVVAKKVETNVADQISTFIRRYSLSSCIYLETDAKRYYPYSTLCSQLVGFVDGENKGAYGLELMYEDTLAGTEGRIVTAKSSTGTDLLYYFDDYYQAEDGSSVYLNIDANIQNYCEQILAKGVEKYNVLNGGWCIAMDPNTGEVLGMASSPSYDLNNPSDITDEASQKQLEKTLEELNQQVQEGTLTTEERDEQYNEAVADLRFSQWTNRCVNTTYEPGSTFKSIVLASALEEGTINENSTFDCSGVLEYDGWQIHCSARHGHGQLQLAEAVGKSCNIAFMDIGTSMKPTTFWSYLEAFGITEKTGIDLPNEGNSVLWSETEFTSSYGYTDRLVCSFGQRFNVTPIQLITAVSATINGGYLYEPRVLNSIVDADGNTVVDNEPTVVRQVVSESTSAQVRTMLEGVVSKYGGKNAYQAGYRIGGKTGTAQTLNDDEYVVSFIGFAPANDPQIICLLAFDGPEVNVPGTDSAVGSSGYTIYGGTMAAPLCGELIAEICDYMGVAKQYSGDEESKADATVPSVIGMTAEEAEEELTSSNLKYEIVGEGETITAQVPASGTVLANQSTIVLYMGETPANETVAMPDLSGMTPSEARRALEKLGLYYRGSGLSDGKDVAADGQSVAVDTEVSIGTVVTVHFSNKIVEDADA